jgi:hypothetical protein
MFATVGRATVPADIGRHNGRPYDGTRSKFGFRLDRPFLPTAGLVLNIEKETSNDEVWNRFARSFFIK